MLLKKKNPAKELPTTCATKTFRVVKDTGQKEQKWKVQTGKDY